MRFVQCGSSVFAVEDDDSADCEHCVPITRARYVHEVNQYADRLIVFVNERRAERLRKANA